MSRCITVLSLPRSGSSCIAGCLHRLGVDMGAGHLQHADKNNPRGYYEDQRWQQITKALAGRYNGGYQIKRVWALPERQAREYDSLAQTCARKPLWGMKGPDMAFTFQYVHPIVARYAEVRVVRVQREREAVIRSLMAHSRRAYGGRAVLNRPRATQLLEQWSEALEAGLKAFGGPILDVRYEDVIADPETQIALLQGYTVPPGGSANYAGQWQDAVGFVDSKLQHQGRNK